MAHNIHGLILATDVFLSCDLRDRSALVNILREPLAAFRRTRGELARAMRCGPRSILRRLNGSPAHPRSGPVRPSRRQSDPLASPSSAARELRRRRGRHFRGRPSRPVVAASEQDTLTVTTFNIQFGLAAGRAARELALAARFRRPDLILLQEMDPAGSAAIARELGCHHVYAPAVVHSHHGRQFGQAILSPWPLRDAEIVHLPHTHPVERATPHRPARHRRRRQPRGPRRQRAHRDRPARGEPARRAAGDHPRCLRRLGWPGRDRRGLQHRHRRQRERPRPARPLRRFRPRRGLRPHRRSGWPAACALPASPSITCSRAASISHSAPTTLVTRASDHRPLWATLPSAAGGSPWPRPSRSDRPRQPAGTGRAPRPGRRACSRS